MYQILGDRFLFLTIPEDCNNYLTNFVFMLKDAEQSKI